MSRSRRSPLWVVRQASLFAAMWWVAACSTIGDNPLEPDQPAAPPPSGGRLPEPSSGVGVAEASQLSTNDADVQGLGNTTQPVLWYYILNQATQRWYIVSPTGGAVLNLNRVDRNTSFGIYWKPINNYSASSSASSQGYPDAGNNYSTVRVSSDGRSIHFGSLTNANVQDPDVRALANTDQPVRWFYIFSQSTRHWYIVSPAGGATLLLHKVDQATSFGIYWKPINNYLASNSPSTNGYSDAGINFTSVVISSDGRTITFGSVAGAGSWITFDYPVGTVDGTGWLLNRGGYGFLEDNPGVKCPFAYHPGYDFNKDGTSFDQDQFEPVYAVADGVVVASLYDNNSAWGNIIVVEHTFQDGTKIWSLYGHLDDRLVMPGSKVTKRQLIGHVGKGDGTLSAHLHFEIRRTNMAPTSFPCGQSKAQVLVNYADPLLFLDTHR